MINYRSIINRITFILLLSFIFTLSGCGFKSINLIKTGSLSVETKSEYRVNIEKVFVKKRKTDVLMHADVTPKGPMVFFNPGHLMFEVFSPDGTRIFSRDVVRHTDRHPTGNRSKMKHASFWIRTPLDIPDGSVLKVTQHSEVSHELAFP